MKCKALTQSGINLIKVEQDRLPVIVAKKDSDGVYSYKSDSPSGRRKNIVDKSTKPKCVCSAKSKTNFQCPKVGSRKEGGDKLESGSLWRVTPTCFCIQKL